MDPGALLGWAVDQLIPGATKMPARQLRAFLQKYEIDGRHVSDWGFWNLLARGLSHEAYELARASGGYDTPLMNWNALDTISLNFDLAEGVTYNAMTAATSRCRRPSRDCSSSRAERSRSRPVSSPSSWPTRAGSSCT